MQGVAQYPDAYEDCLVVKKLRQQASQSEVVDMLVFDKDGTIQKFAHPVEMPDESEATAGKEIRRITAAHPVIFSSAQTPELSWSSGLYDQSVGYGFDRRRPNIRLPNGDITHKPEEVKGWEYLCDPDAFVGLGTGIFVRKNGGYICDREFEKALGGPTWRLQTEVYLNEIFPDRGYRKLLSPVDLEDPVADVQKHAFRLEFNGYGEEGARALDSLMQEVTRAQLEEGFLRNAAFIDESNLIKKRYTRYLVPKYGTKELALEHFGNQVSAHSGVPTSRMRITKFGDAPPDVATGLSANQGAKEVRLVIAAKSRISESILNNADCAGVPLPGCPNHPTLPGRFYQTETPGVLWWRGAQGQRPRQVFLAEYTPWSREMDCTQSVLATLKYLGFR